MMACVSDPKRGRGGTSTPSALSLNEEASCQRGQLVPETLCHLLLLPEEVVEIILSHLDARTLVRLEQVCSWFRRLARGSRMSITEKAAKEAVLRHCQGNLAEASRWRNYSWIQRLRIEETTTAFDKQRCEEQGFLFFEANDGSVARIKLEGPGPKLLLSDQSTATSELLHWRIELRGNNAVEFGVVPASLQDQPKCLHKCHILGKGNDRPSGMCSSITVGSALPVRVPLMKGSDIEVLASRTRLEFIVVQPPDGMEMTWINSVTVPKPYRGPKQFRFEMDLDNVSPIKLAITCWARGEVGVVESGPRKKMPAPHEITRMQQMADANNVGAVLGVVALPGGEAAMQAVQAVQAAHAVQAPVAVAAAADVQAAMAAGTAVVAGNQVPPQLLALQQHIQAHHHQHQQNQNQQHGGGAQQQQQQHRRAQQHQVAYQHQHGGQQQQQQQQQQHHRAHHAHRGGSGATGAGARYGQQGATAGGVAHTPIAPQHSAPAASSAAVMSGAGLGQPQGQSLASTGASGAAPPTFVLPPPTTLGAATAAVVGPLLASAAAAVPGPMEPGSPFAGGVQAAGGSLNSQPQYQNHWPGSYGADAQGRERFSAMWQDVQHQMHNQGQWGAQQQQQGVLMQGAGSGGSHGAGSGNAAVLNGDLQQSGGGMLGAGAGLPVEMDAEGPAMMAQQQGGPLPGVGVGVGAAHPLGFAIMPHQPAQAASGSAGEMPVQPDVSGGGSAHTHAYTTSEGIMITEGMDTGSSVQRQRAAGRAAVGHP